MQLWLCICRSCWPESAYSSSMQCNILLDRWKLSFNHTSLYFALTVFYISRKSAKLSAFWAKMEDKRNGNKAFVLGIDLGTTTVKVAVIDAVTKKSVTSRSYSQRTYADVATGNANFSEQNVEKIWAALNKLLVEIGQDVLSNVIVKQSILLSYICDRN